LPIAPLNDRDAVDAVGLRSLLVMAIRHFHSLWWLTFQSPLVTDSQM
jgi:hypothetical protein